MQLISKLNELLNEVFVEENFDYKLDIVLLLFYEIYLKYMQEARIPLLLKLRKSNAHRISWLLRFYVFDQETLLSFYVHDREALLSFHIHNEETLHSFYVHD